MNIYFFSILFNALAPFILGFFLLSKKNSGYLDRSFYYLLSLLSIFYFTIFALQFSFNLDSAMLLSRLAMAWMILLPLLVLRSVLILIGIYHSYKKVCFFVFLSSLSFIFLDYLGFFIAKVEPRLGFNYWPVAANSFEYFNIYFFALFFFALFILFSRYHQAYISVRQKIKNAIFAILLFYTAFLLDLYLWYGANIPPLGSFVLNFFFVGLFYFFSSNKIIDLKLAMRRSTVTVSSFLAMFSIIVAIKYLLAISDFGYLIWTDYALLVLAIFAYPFIKKRFFSIANRYFFTSLYDPGSVITAFNKKLRSTIDIDEVYALLDKTFSDVFHSSAMGVLFYDYDSKKYSIKYNSGFNVYSDVDFESDSMLFRKFVEPDKIISVDALLKDIQFKERKLVKVFEHFNIKLVVPLVMKDRVLGVVVLADKKSGDAYNNEDIQVLDVISSQATVAFDNALKYEEIKKFKFKLEKEIERATEELRSVNKELKRVDADKSGFISIASHQLRTPLTVIKGYASMILEENFGKLEKTTRDAVDKVFVSSDRLIELVEDLLDISRIESGKQNYEFKKGQLEDLLNNIVEGLEMKAEENNVQLIWEKPSKPLSPIELDEEKLRQSCMNLVENAIKYTGKAGKKDAFVKVEISEDKKGQKIKVRVKDNGLGITKEDMEHLFAKFYRGKNKSITTIEGTGLGLYVAKQIIVEHGGDISVKSEGEGKGAQFDFWIPVAGAKKEKNA